MDLTTDSVSGDQAGLVMQTEANQLAVAGYGHYVDGRGEKLSIEELSNVNHPLLLNGPASRVQIWKNVVKSPNHWTRPLINRGDLDECA